MKVTTASNAAERERRLAAAFNEGRLAGQRQIAAGLNPYEFATEPEEHAEWLRGRSSAEAQRASEELAKRARTCRYRGGACDCGGRGLCLDVA